MAAVTIRLPSLLAAVAGGARELTLEAGTLAEAFAVLKREHPAVARHVFDETGGLRSHVLCFHNDTNTRWLPFLDVPLADGDTLTILQAVSGGSGVPVMRGDVVLGYLGRWRRDPLAVLDEARALGAPAVWFRLGHRWGMLLLHPRHVQHVLVDNQRNYEKKTKGYGKLRLILGDGLLTSGGDFWLRQRRIAQPAFHRERLQSFVAVFQRAAADMVQGWQRRAGETIDVAQEMMRVTLRVVGETLLSTDVRHDADAIGPALTTVLAHTRALITSVLPFSDRWPTEANRRFRAALATLDRIVLGIIEARRSDGAGRRDLLQMLMDARDEESGEGMTDRQLRDEVMTIFLAGHETTANALAWTLHLLVQHPDAEARLRKEVADVLEGRPAGVADLPRLAYTEMVLRESMRLYPPVWIIGRSAIGPDTIEGEAVPAGTFVFLSPYALHRHPSFWAAPDTFDPERFAPDRMKELPRGLYFPFGGGPRICIGQAFAMMEAQAILATIVQGARLTAVADPPVVPEPVITLRPRHGLPMRVSSP